MQPVTCHLPQGRCGLKLIYPLFWLTTSTSPSARKVWIEICGSGSTVSRLPVTFRKEGVDWNYVKFVEWGTSKMSPSVRKVWIEILIVIGLKSSASVTFRKEGADWNFPPCTILRLPYTSLSAGKVWIEIDRTTYIELLDTSPSARKVWTKIRCNILDLKKVFCAKVYWKCLWLQNI